MANAMVHVVMGEEEAHTIGAALALLINKINFDMERFPDESEKDRNEFMAMLSVSFCAEGMLQSLGELLGHDEWMEQDDE